MELFSGINGSSAQSKLPDCSYLLNVPLGLQLCCLCCVSARHGAIYTMQDLKESL